MSIKMWTNRKKYVIHRKGVEPIMKKMSYIDNMKKSLDKISLKLKVSEGENGMIKLDKNNSAHREWFNEEE